MATRAKQLSLDDLRRRTGRGGPRPGAGRPPGPRPCVHHVRRPRVRRDFPSHITLRVRRGIPSLRKRRFVQEFRVVHYSLQRDHVHLIVESAGKEALGRGMKSISARLARAVNRVFGRRGRVLDGRYHLHVLRSRREVRNALAYVLLNVRKHWKGRRGLAPPLRLDEASSSRWFDGWRRPAPRDGPEVQRPEVSRPRTWLLCKGWRRYGLIDPAEVPGSGS